MFNYKEGTVSCSLYNERHSSVFVKASMRSEILRVVVAIRIAVDSQELYSFFPPFRNPSLTHITKSDTDLQASLNIKTKCFSLTHTELGGWKSSEHVYSMRHTPEEQRTDRATPVLTYEMTVHNEVCVNLLRDPGQHPPTAGTVADSRRFAIHSRPTVSRASQCGITTAPTTIGKVTFDLATSGLTPLMSNEQSDIRTQVERCQTLNPLTHVELTLFHRGTVLLTTTPDTAIGT